LHVGVHLERLAVLLRLPFGHERRQVLLAKPRPEPRVELLGLDLERALERLVDVRAERVPVFVDEVANALHPVLLPHVLEHRVAEAIGEVAARVLRDARDPVVHDRVAQHHPVARLLVLGHERRQPFHHPLRRVGRDGLAELPLEQDLELEDVRQLVRDELQQLVVRHVDRQHHPVAGRLGERADALGDEVEHDVRLLERRVRGVEDQRDLLRDLVVEFLREIEVRRLRAVDHALQLIALLVIEVNVEVRGVVDVPLEGVVDDLVLAERVRGGRNHQRHKNEKQPDVTLQRSLHITGPIRTN
jgi:hypothetical protein